MFVNLAWNCNGPLCAFSLPGCHAQQLVVNTSIINCVKQKGSVLAITNANIQWYDSLFTGYCWHIHTNTLNNQSTIQNYMLLFPRGSITFFHIKNNYTANDQNMRYSLKEVKPWPQDIRILCNNYLRTDSVRNLIVSISTVVKLTWRIFDPRWQLITCFQEGWPWIQSPTLLQGMDLPPAWWQTTICLAKYAWCRNIMHGTFPQGVWCVSFSHRSRFQHLQLCSY